MAVFRARHDGERTAAALATLGHTALLAPVMAIVPTGAPVPVAPVDGVVVTSAHGIEALDAVAIDRLRRLPCFCVGPRTALLAAQAGFRDTRTAWADAERLASLVCSAFDAPATLLLVAGRDRKPTLEVRLAAARHRVVVIEAYEARALTAWRDDVCQAFRERPATAALHYSRRSAELALAVAARMGVRDVILPLVHHCLSADAAAPLVAAGAPRIVIAAAMNEDGLLASLA